MCWKSDFYCLDWTINSHKEERRGGGERLYGDGHLCHIIVLYHDWVDLVNKPELNSCCSPLTTCSSCSLCAQLPSVCTSNTDDFIVIYCAGFLSSLKVRLKTSSLYCNIINGANPFRWVDQIWVLVMRFMFLLEYRGDWSYMTHYLVCRFTHHDWIFW